jgi:hypothetical protein
MGAGFIIINRAIKNAAEKIREDEKREAKLIADGYTRELVLKNPSDCYIHYFRNFRKQQHGVIFACTSLLGISIIAPVLIVFPFTMWFWIPIITICIFLLVGLSKFFNTEQVLSSSRHLINREGCFHLKTIYDPRYDYEWIKKNK